VQALDAQRALSQAEAELLRFRRAQMDELNESSNELVQIQEQLTKLKDRLDRVEVLSPSDGVVQDLKFRTVGGVIPAGAMLMNVVPVDSQMHAEVRVSPVDIGFVKWISLSGLRSVLLILCVMERLRGVCPWFHHTAF